MRKRMKGPSSPASDTAGGAGTAVDGPADDTAELGFYDGSDVDVVPLDLGPVGEWLADPPGTFHPVGCGSAGCLAEPLDEPLDEPGLSVLFPSADARLDRALVVLEGVAAAESRVFAAKMHALAEAAMGAREADAERGHDLTSEFLPTHVAGTLTVHRGTAQAQVEQALHLLGRLPGTWRLLDAGRLRVPQALVLVEETAGRSPAVCAAVERQLLQWLPGRTASEVRRRVRRVLKRLEDQAEAARARAKAVAARAVSVLPLPDGMTGIWATMPAGAATVFAAALRQLAARFTTEDDQRTAEQRQSDVLAVLPSLVLDGLTGRLGPQVQAAMAAAGFRPGGRAGELTSVLLVPAASALGLSDEPAELTGYGPITAEHARALLRTAALRLAELDPETGRLLSLSERCYRPTEADLAGLTGLTAEAEPGWPPTGPTDPLGPPFGPTGPTGPAGPDSGSGPGAGPDSGSGPEVGPDSGCGPAARPASGYGPAAGADSGYGSAERPDQADRPNGSARPGSPDGSPASSPASSPHSPSDAGPGVNPNSSRPAPGWHRWLADQLAGRLPKPLDEPQYRPSAALDRFVRLRDLRCTGIGCSSPAHRCDIEHRDPWPDGPTGPDNLSPVSRRCHRMKQNGWSYTRSPDGTTTWTAPGGRRYHKPADSWPIDALLPRPPTS